MPAISVFTPSHQPQYLNQCYDSLYEQTEKDWEWVVLLNSGAKWVPPSDPRVILKHHPAAGIGALKAKAISYCQSKYLVELDHDDKLAPEALASIIEAFELHPDESLVYSDNLTIDQEGNVVPHGFNPLYGWDEVEGAMEPLPHNVSYIWYAPNHVRAFRKSDYDKAGGYDPELGILDDQDLMSRLYQLGDFHHINEPLYFQRQGGTSGKPNAINEMIQIGTVEMYDKYVQPNVLAWAKRNALLCLDLGAAHNPVPGYEGIDIYDGPGVTYIGDALEHLAAMPDQSVGVIRAVDFLEHMYPDQNTDLFNEMHRVLEHGGMLLSLTPSTDGRGAFQDPTHRSFYNEHTFWYYGRRDYAKFIPEYTGNFQISRLSTGYQSDWHIANQLPYVCANLVANHEGGPRMGGLL